MFFVYVELMDAITSDRAEYLAARDSSHKELLTHAAKASGRSVLKIQSEFNRMKRSPNRINLVEYVRTGLYDIARYSEEERSAFLSNDLHWPIAHTCNNRAWYAAAEDKMLAGALLQAGGVRTPDTIAVLDRSQRSYPGVPKVASAEALTALLREHRGERLFCKVVDGMVSFGAFRIENHDDSQVTCTGRAPLSHAEFLEIMVGDNAYAVQRTLSNHAALKDYASALATVRMVNLVTDTGVVSPFAVIKLPQDGNVADAFWRPGNLACSIDPETGRVITIARRGIEMEYLDAHPDIPGLLGLELPFWSELRDMNARAARIFAPIRYQSTDIAITQDGPVIVELNYGGGFDLPQYAARRGFLTPEVRAFFDSCGVDLAAASSRRSWLRRR